MIFFIIISPYAHASCFLSHLKETENIRALASWVSCVLHNQDHLKMSGSLVSNSNRQRGNYTSYMFPPRLLCCRHNSDTVPPCFNTADRNTAFLCCYEKLTQPYYNPPPTLCYLSQSPLSLPLSSPHLFFHFRNSLSFQEQGGMIVASAGGGEPNAIITPRAIINSVSNGDGGRRIVDCCRSSEIILEGFVFSLALPTVLFNYSAGVPTASLFPRRAAGREPLF